MKFPHNVSWKTLSKRSVAGHLTQHCYLGVASALKFEGMHWAEDFSSFVFASFISQCATSDILVTLCPVKTKS